MPRPINTPTTASKNITMESSSKESQNLFKRLITYHCFRENKYAKGTASYLNKIYGKSFISEGAVQKWFKLFKDKEDFSFDDICSLGYVARKRRSEKPIPEDPPELDAETEQELANGEAKQMEEKGAVKVKRTATGKVVAKKATSSTTDTGGPDGGAETAGDGSGSENNTTNLDRCEKRKLILRCYKAKYSVGEANRYLNSIHGQGFINKTSVYTWYRRFEQKDFKLGDKNRSGRPQKVDDAKGKEIIAYVEGNPSVNLRQIASAFKLSTGTLSRLLPKLGFQYVVDKWVKTQERPEVTDEQLRAFKEANPTAKVKEVAEHFMISRIVIAQRLRKLGFDIPKWPKKKKNAAGAAGAASGDANPPGPSGGQVDGTKSRGRTTKGRQTTSQPQLGPGQQPGPESIHPQSTPGAQLVNVKLDFGPANLAAEAQMRAMQMAAEQQQHNQNRHDPGTQQSQSSVPPQPDHTQQGGHPLSRINMEQLLSLQQHSPHNGPPPTGSQGPSPGPSGPPPPPSQHIEQSQSQQQQPQQYVMNLAQVSVNSLLPAVLRRKPNAILPGSLVKGPGGPLPPPPQQQQQVPVSLGGNPMGGGGLGGGQGQGPNEVRDLRIGISQMAENLSTNGSQQQQQGPRPIVTSNGYHMPPTSSLMTSHVTHSGPYSSHGASLQNLVQATASGGSQQQPGQGQQGPGGQHDPMNGFDPYNAPPLDSIQVQNILHPYYQ